jgi:hypothetical protein
MWRGSDGSDHCDSRSSGDGGDLQLGDGVYTTARDAVGDCFKVFVLSTALLWNSVSETSPRICK